MYKRLASSKLMDVFKKTLSSSMSDLDKKKY